MRNNRLASPLVLFVFLAACSDSTTVTDGGTGLDGPATDGHSGTDGGGTGTDGGGTGTDGGGTGTDGGTTGTDAGPMTCDDGIACTLDGTSAMGVCTHVPSDALCDAMPGGTCSRTTGCVYPIPCTMASDCDDSNACTRDICGATSMTCFHMNVAGGTPCDDGLTCTTGDACNRGVCVGMTSMMCDDMNPCTADSCDASGACTHTNVTDGTACRDGNFCTRGETCMAGVCTPGTTTTCTMAGEMCCPTTGMCAATCP